MIKKILPARFPASYEDRLVTLLRYTLALIFVWFGLLKVWNYNPVFDLVDNSLMPFLASGAGLVGLGIFETLIGLLLFTNRLLRTTHIVLVLHLAGTFSTFLFGWDVVFDPGFPVLNLNGEFVVKNLILAAAGLVVLVHEDRKRDPAII